MKMFRVKVASTCVLLALVLSNMWFSLFWYTEDQPIAIISQNPNAIVSLLSLVGERASDQSLSYITSLCKLAVSFRVNGGREHDLVLLVVGPKLPYFRMLKRAGWIVVYVDGIGQPLKHTFNYNRYAESLMFSKFQMWRLTSYKHVTYVDSDTIVLRDPMPALTKAYEMVMGDVSGMVIDLGFCVDNYFNAGVMVIRPSMKVFSDLLFYRNWVIYNDGYVEQGFLNAFYAGSLISLPTELNVPAYYYNDSCRFVDPSKTVIAHYNGDTKPWQINCTSHPVCRYWHETPLYRCRVILAT